MFACRATLGLVPSLRSATSITTTALRSERRGVSQLVSNLAAHSMQLQGCTSLGMLLYSPLGTAMLVALAYNVVVIGTKHVIYTMEITGKDYVQDQQLHMIMRYGMLSCILLAMEVIFVEV